MSERAQTMFAGPGGMFLSAAIFGFFGFYYFNIGATPTVYASVFLWTLKCISVAFAICAVVTMTKPFVGNIAYAVCGLYGAVSFLVVAVMDLLDDGPPLFGYSVPILLFFAAWNGWSSWTSLRAVIALRGPGESRD